MCESPWQYLIMQYFSQWYPCDQPLRLSLKYTYVYRILHKIINATYRIPKYIFLPKMNVFLVYFAFSRAFILYSD